MSSFAFRTAGQVLFGRGEARRLPELAVRLGRRALVVTGKTALERAGLLGALLSDLGQRLEHRTRWVVDHEPDVALVDEGARLARAERCDLVLGIGGGAVMDAAKAVASLATNGGSALDYLEDVGPAPARTLREPSLTTVLVPTTAGTGSEVTRNSVLRVPERACKRSMRSDHLLPRVAMVDPTLSARAPRAIAASSGLDALAHLVEGYVSRAANPITDALARSGILLAMSGLRALAAGAPAPEASDGLALASTYGGMVLANAGLGAAHGLAAPLGGRLGIAHGVACACLLPPVMLANVRALRDREPENPALARYHEMAAWVLEHGEPGPERAADEIDRLRRKLGVPSFTALGLGAADLPAVLAECRGGSMKGNPVLLDDEELQGVLEGCLEG